LSVPGSRATETTESGPSPPSGSGRGTRARPASSMSLRSAGV
jgi:hypothetical protein